jgi:hypothetical protein
MFSGIKKLITNDGITHIDVNDLIEDISDKVCIIIRITLIVGFVLGAIGMAIVNKIVG